MTVLYFISTGKGIHVAKEIGGELLSIPKMVKENRYHFKDYKIGIVVPVYENKLPPYVMDFINKAEFDTDYLYAVLTYGIFSGNAAKKSRKI